MHVSMSDLVLLMCLRSEKLCKVFLTMRMEAFERKISPSKARRAFIAVTLLLLHLLPLTESSWFPRHHNGRILLLDVDNTLYAESHHSIEQQIVHNIHDYCQKKLQMSPRLADDLHRQYGSTIEGLRQTVWKHMSRDNLSFCMQDFYDTVYSNISVDSLLLGRSSADTDGGPTTTGYTHQQQEQDWIRRFWKSCPHAIHVASNSPLIHIQKVLQAMGLCSASSKKRWFTPDGLTNDETIVYPTKYHPRAFFGSSFLDSDQKLVLLDDSLRTLEACAPYCTGIHINHTHTLQTALSQVMGWLNPHYSFSSVQYLVAKARVDASALDRDTWLKVGQELKDLLLSK